MDMVTFVRESSVSPEEMLMKSTKQLGFLVGPSGSSFHGSDRDQGCNSRFGRCMERREPMFERTGKLWLN